MADDDKMRAKVLAGAMEHGIDLGLDEVPMVHVCQGPPRCDYNGENRPPGFSPADCKFCGHIRADDPRSAEEIIADMNRMQS